MLFVITTQGNEVTDIRTFKSDTAQQQYFEKECQAYGIEITEEDFDRGVVHLECGTSINLVEA